MGGCKVLASTVLGALYSQRLIFVSFYSRALHRSVQTVLGIMVGSVVTHCLLPPPAPAVQVVVQMRTIFVFVYCTHLSLSLRTKRADPMQWQNLMQLDRIIRASNVRALEIENFTKQAAVRQNQRNMLLASSSSVLSPMAALAMANNRFTPPDILPLARSEAHPDLMAKLLADREYLFGTALPPAFPLRDIPSVPPLPPLPPPPVPPSLVPPPPMILPRVFHPRMRTRGVAVVETPLSIDEPITRIFPRPSQPTEPDESREKLPMRMRADEYKRKEYPEYVTV
ncbi:unnamed protein product [Cylicocyclus nassatus]|uniref:Uncharacterized protein n=1 Tax=Cylicocyclus nassatus TaxID=53992 RepID=A0AA36M294_CYLNA|nr:unnamed protein product [Cylicocyclus nassatus]